MKKLMTYLLLLATLWSGVAFAWDSDPEVIVGHGAVVIDLAAADHDYPNNGLQHCDHCCHGAAHLTGIFYDTCMQDVAASRNHHSFLAITPTSLYIAPLLRPPIV
ncbi:MAG: hypothetical protein GXP17_06990 [Gammaproteobacteria bacterium]|nr:hypothetical protein [Gammaproteobacteria bacterium]